MSTEVIDRYLAEAASHIGEHWPKASPYGQWYDKKYAGGKGIYVTGAWCAMFLSYCAEAASIGTDVFPPHAYTPSGVAWFQSRGQFVRGVRGIRRGDIWYSSCSGLGRVSHTGIVERVYADGSFDTIEGNTSITAAGSQDNGRRAARKRRNTACSLGGYARPAYASAAARPIPTPTKNGFLMTLSDAQQAQVYDAVVQHTPNGDYYKPDALINILRDEVIPLLTLIRGGHILFPGANYYLANAIVNTIREDGTPAPAVDVATLAKELAPLIASNVRALSEADLENLAKESADELARRLTQK